MAKPTRTPTARPKPGPRKPKGSTAAHRSGPAPHGTTRRRVAHQTAKPARQKKLTGSGARGATKKATADVERKSRQVTERKSRQVTAASIPFHRPEREVEPATVAKWWLLVGLVITIGFVVSVLEAPFFEARSVQVSGIARTSDGAVMETIALEPDKALLRYDTNEAQERLATLPWVKSVEVTRQWPSTVRVVVRERSVWATLGTPSGTRWLVLGDDGVVVEERLTPPTGVPVIIGTETIVDQSQVGETLAGAERALEISHDLPLQLDPWITTWTTDDAGRVSAHLVGSAVAEFGAFEDHRTQFVSLASILDGGAPLTCLDTIDLSVADTPVLHRNATCMSAAREMTKS